MMSLMLKGCIWFGYLNFSTHIFKGKWRMEGMQKIQSYLEATETGQQQETRGTKDQRTEDRLDDLQKKQSKLLTGRITSRNPNRKARDGSCLWFEISKPALEDMLKSKLVTGQERESLLSSARGNTAGCTHLLGKWDKDNQVINILASWPLTHCAASCVGHTLATEFNDTSHHAGEGSPCRRAAKQPNIPLPKQN